MDRRNILPPAESGEYVAKHATHVKICEDGIEKICEEMLKNVKDNKLVVPSTGADDIHPLKNHPKVVDWIFVVDVLNFCFWSYQGAQKWTVNGYTGYYGLEAALCRAMKEGYDITNPKYYSKITEEQIRHIMRSDNETEIPLISERVLVLQEVGKILLDKFNGTFETCVKLAERSAMKLLEIIVENFPCFRDEYVYKGKTLGLYKRAQILVADIWNFFHGTGWGEMDNIEKLTMFADYRIPQVLLYFGALKYSPELMHMLMIEELLPTGSAEEVEIRGCSIHAIELIKSKLEEMTRERGIEMEIPNSSIIDYYLWSYRRCNADAIDIMPFHKTLGIFY